MIESVEETLRAAEKRVEICEKDLARAEAVLIGVKLVISALERHEVEQRREQDEFTKQALRELFERHWQRKESNE